MTPQKKTLSFKNPDVYGTSAADELRERATIKDASTTEPLPKKEAKPGVEVLLPSRGKFYSGGQTSVTISQLTVGQVRNIHAAVSSPDPYTQEATFANVISGSVSGISVFDLTTDDYKFILYWIRLNSYLGTPYTVSWDYTRDGITKTVRSIVEFTNFKVDEIEQHKMFDPEFGYPTVRDHLDLLQISDASDAYIAEYAQYMAGSSLAEKIEIIKNKPSHMLPRLRDHMLDSFHGISEEAGLTDPNDKQGEMFQIPLVIRIGDFFP